MLYQIKQYIKFILNSSNQHGVHSPFVYDLVTKCFYDKTKYRGYQAIQNYRKSLLENPTKIKVTDLGAGSQVMKHKARSVSDIAKNAGTTHHRAKLMLRLTRYFKPHHVLELGTSLGIGTHALSLGNPEAYITSIEGCPNTASYTKKQLEGTTSQRIKIITGAFNEQISQLTANHYNLIFFDGNHQKEATLQYFETLLKTADNDSIFIFDDIYWSQGMQDAWETIKAHPKVTVTIDTFFWGFVFFRKEQVKEHFKIRL